jgi:glycosyltransferase 2 family protein
MNDDAGRARRPAISPTAASPRTQAGPVPTGRSLGRLRRIVAWLPGILALIALAIVLLKLGELKRLLALLGDLDPAWIGLAALPQLATYAAAASVWYVVLRRAQHRRHLAGLYLLGIAKLFMDQALPSGGVSGSLLVVAALRRRGVSTHIATAALLVGMISFYLAFIIGAGASLIVMALDHALNGEIVVLVIVFLFIALALLLAIFWLRRGHGTRLEKWLGHLPMGRPFWEAIRDAPAALLRDIPLLLSTTLLQLAIIALDAATLWILLDALGAGTSYGVAFAGFVLASIFADVAPVPLGLGSFEVALVGLLGLMGTDLAAATAGTLLLRGLSFWAPMLPGLWLARREIRGAAALPAGAGSAS